MQPVVCVVARDRSHAPPVVEGLIRALTGKGLRVAAVIEGETDIRADGLSEEAARYQSAGSEAVTLRSPQTVAAIRRLREEPSLDELVWEMRDEYDVVLAEGFQHSSYPKVEVRSRGEELVCHRNELLAVIGEKPADLDVPSFDPNDLSGLADLIRRRFMTPDVGEDAALFIDGVRLPIALFVRKMVASTVLGMVRALKGVEHPRSVVVAVKTRPREKG